MKRYILNNVWNLSIILISATFGTVSACYFYTSGNSNLAYTDASIRLYIAKAIFNSLTPGLFQLGKLWPPFPQVLMIPFVTSDFLWRSGLAGWIVSGSSYILTCLIIYAIVHSITKKPIFGFIASISFLVNINVLYFQTTAMSESFFWLTIAAGFYFLYRYLVEGKTKYLILTAAVLDVSTLTRYEGYALLAASVLIVFLSCVLNRYDLAKTAKTTIAFAAAGSLGIIVWSLYLFLLTGRPFFWLHYHDLSSSTSVAINYALPSFAMAIINMCGLFTAIAGFAAFIYILLSKKFTKNIKLMLILPFSLLILMALALNSTTPVYQPFMSLATLLTKNTNLYYEYNVRYGLNLLIYLIIFAVIAAQKIRRALLFYTALITVQTFAYFASPLYLTYQLRETAQYRIPSYVPWFNSNYDRGLVLISAAKHAPEMLKMDLPPSSFIDENTGYYWTESLSDPAKYAKWIIFDSVSQGADDFVTGNFAHKNLKSFGFVQIYGGNGIEIFKKYK